MRNELLFSRGVISKLRAKARNDLFRRGNSKRSFVELAGGSLPYLARVGSPELFELFQLLDVHLLCASMFDGRVWTCAFISVS